MPEQRSSDKLDHFAAQVKTAVSQGGSALFSTSISQLTSLVTQRTGGFLKKLTGKVFSLFERKSRQGKLFLTFSPSRPAADVVLRGLSRIQRLAIVLMSLPPGHPKAVLKDLEPDEIEEIVFAAEELPTFTTEMSDACIQEVLSPCPELCEKRGTPREKLYKLAIDHAAVFSCLIRSIIHHERKALRGVGELRDADENTSRDSLVHLSGEAESGRECPAEGEHPAPEFDREIAAALLFSHHGSCPRWFRERVLQLLAPDEIEAIGRGLRKASSGNSADQGVIWGFIQEFFDGDWLDEGDIALFIRRLLKHDLSKPAGDRWVKRMATLLLLIPPEVYSSVLDIVKRSIPPHCFKDLISDLAGRAFKKDENSKTSTLQSFFRFLRQQADASPLRQPEAGSLLMRLCREDPRAFASALYAMILKEKNLYLRFQKAALRHPLMMAAWILRFSAASRGVTDLSWKREIEWIAGQLKTEQRLYVKRFLERQEIVLGEKTPSLTASEVGLVMDDFARTMFLVSQTATQKNIISPS